MKYLANGISISRIFFTILLILIRENPPFFALFYLLCGLSDLLDGHIARKTGTASSVGARIDSVADLFWILSITGIFFFQYGTNLKVYLPLLVIVLIIRCFNLIYSAVKYRSPIFLHTWGNKLSGVLVFFAPLLYMFVQNGAIVVIVCSVALLSSLEESILFLKSEKPDPDIRGIFIKSAIRDRESNLEE